MPFFAGAGNRSGRKRMFPSTFDGEKKALVIFTKTAWDKQTQGNLEQERERDPLLSYRAQRTSTTPRRWKTATTLAVQETASFAPCYTQTHPLPRQARDKHRESTPQKVAFAFGAAAGGEEGQQQQLLSVLCEPTDLGRLCNEVRASGYTVTEVRKTPFLRRHFILGLRRSDRFTKTGSGQT